MLYLVSCKEKPNKIKRSKLDSLKESAQIYYDRENFSQALIIYNEIIRLDSTIDDIHYKRGVSNIQLGNNKKAIVDFLKAVEVEYRVGDANFNIALCYSNILDFENAIKYFENVLIINPNDLQAKVEIEECRESMKLFKR